MILNDNDYITHSDSLPIEWDFAVGWYFCDEHGGFGDGPYETEELAIEKFREYCEQLHENKE